MTKDDRQFITNSIMGLENKITLEMGSLRDDVRQNGVMIEHLQDIITSVAENTLGLNRRLNVVENHLDLQA